MSRCDRSPLEAVGRCVPKPAADMSWFGPTALGVTIGVSVLSLLLCHRSLMVPEHDYDYTTLGKGKPGSYGSTVYDKMVQQAPAPAAGPRSDPEEWRRWERERARRVR